MSKFYGGNMGDTHEGILMFFGLLAFLTAGFYFLQSSGIMTLSFTQGLTDRDYLYFFAGVTFVSGIIHIFSTIGFLSRR